MLFDYAIKDFKNLLLLLFSLLSCTQSIVTIILGLTLGLTAKLLRWPVWLILSIGILGIILALVFNITPQQLQFENKFLWQQVGYRNYQASLTWQICLDATPYALLYASLLGCLTYTPLGLRQAVQQLGSGQAEAKQKRDAKLSIGFKSAAKTIKNPNNGAILGIEENSKKPVILTDQDANMHTLVVGTTGSGKTTTLINIMQSVIQRKLALFYVDGKGDLTVAAKLQQLAKQQDTQFYKFSMLGASVKYNPLACGGFTAKKDRIIALRQWTEPHYQKIAEGYLQTVFKVLTECKVKIDLCNLAKYCNPSKLSLLARNAKNPELLEEIQPLFAQQQQVVSLIAEINNITNSELGELFNCQSGNQSGNQSGKILQLATALQQQAIVYIGLQPLAFPSYAETLGKLIINDLKALIATQLLNNKQQKIFTVFDEFSIFAGEPIIHLINQGRSAGVHAILATQSLSDIISKGGQAMLGQILNNVNNYIIQRQNHPEDAEILANVIGTETGVEITSQLQVKDGSTPVGSVRATKQFIIHPDAIKRLACGQAIVVNKAKFSVRKIKCSSCIKCEPPR